MEVLCARCSALAFTGVETLIANGLVIFATPANDPSKFPSKIAATLGSPSVTRSTLSYALTLKSPPQSPDYRFTRRAPPSHPKSIAEAT